jgi:hypothetical protein
MYVNNIHSFLLLSSILLTFIQLIYTHIDLLKVVCDTGEAPTNPASKSNSRGAGGILLREVLREKGEHSVENEEHYM